MAITIPTLCTREDVKSAVDFAETARNDGQVDRAIEAAVPAVDRVLHRSFHPTIATRTFDWPDPSRRGTPPWRLWLGKHELISVTSMTSGGETIAAGDRALYPTDGPPYTRVELVRSSAAALGGGSTPQGDITIVGVYGFRADEAAAGQLVEALDASETAVDVSDSALIGVGDVIKVDSERMLVTGKSMLDTAQNTTALTASAAAVSITGITAGTLKVGETILIDSERMLVLDIAGTTVTVKRAWDGSALAAHTSTTDIYAPRTLTVVRGVLGTAAATHSDTTAIVRHVNPGLVRELAVAEAINFVLQETSGYARTVGSGDSERETWARGLRDIREQARTAYGRKARIGAV